MGATQVISALLIVISVLLTAIVGVLVSSRSDQKSFSKEVMEAIKLLVSDKLCLERREKCPNCGALNTLTESHNSLKSGFQCHSHTELPSHSVLYYKDKA